MPYFARGTYKFIESYPGIQGLPCEVIIVQNEGRIIRRGRLVGTIACGDEDERNGKGLVHSVDNKGEKIEMASEVDCYWSTEEGSRRTYHMLRLENGGYDPILPDGMNI